MPRQKFPAIDVSRIRLAAPAYMEGPVRCLFEDIVATVAADHFAPCDAPLLEQYAIAATQAREAADALRRQGAVVDGKASPWIVVQEKSQRAMVALAMRLRISPQSRFDRLKAGTTARTRGQRRKPWEPATAGNDT